MDKHLHFLGAGIPSLLSQTHKTSIAQEFQNLDISHNKVEQYRQQKQRLQFLEQKRTSNIPVFMLRCCTRKFQKMFTYIKQRSC